jgi:UDP-glucose 4-epimerase
MDKKRVLITGAAGLVGTNFNKLLCNEYEIHALVRTKPETCDHNITYYECDFEDGILIDNFPKKIDAIVHLAQSNWMRDFPVKAPEIFKVNVQSTALLLDYGQKAGATHFIFASTGGIYGASAEPFDEGSEVKIPNGPLGYYFNTKYASENLVRAYADYMAIHILRPFFIYGPNQKNTMLLPRLVENIRKGNPITLQGHNGISINPVHVSDVVKLIDKCLSINQNLTINVAGPDILSMREISEIIGAHVAKTPEFTHVDGAGQNIIAKNDVMLNNLEHTLVKFKKGILDIL